MEITRRDFLKVSGAAGAGLLLGSFAFDLKTINEAYAGDPTWVYSCTTICCYCAVGCGLLVYTDDVTPAENRTVTHVEGNPDHPINEGALCSKGAGMAQLRTVDGALNPNRLLTPKKRLAGGSDWIDITWAEAITDIAGLIKGTRDTTTDDAWNRCTGIASFGGAAHDNEECYLLIKLLRALGMVYIEHQARI
jgi:formate dehydrogenase major subunit